MGRRVVITGMGLVTPLGTGVERTWDALIAGRSGIGPITRFDATGYDTRIAGEARDFRAEDWVEKREIRRLDAFMHYAMAASSMALTESGLPVSPGNADRVGCIIGSGIGGLASLEETHKKLLEKGPSRVSPFFIPQMIANLAAGNVSIRYGLKGPCWAPVSACASGAHALGEAMRAIARGECDAVVAGGAEATVTPLAIAGFNAMRAMCTDRNDAPERASRPFDLTRSGFVPGEGSGIVVLEELEHARRRGARFAVELAGYGANADAHHITAPAPGGEGAARCIRLALADAGVEPEAVGYVNAHGTSTPYNDAIETQALRAVFGERAREIPVSATKSMTGHLLGAAGSVEAIFTALSLARGVAPPTINYETPDPACDLDYVPNRARALAAEVAVSNSFGFGGTNAVLVFRRVAG